MKRTLAFVLSLALAVIGLSGAALAEAEWSCPGCGAENLTGKFCPECGSARPAEDWICPNCERTNQRQYCPDCGTSRDALQPDAAVEAPEGTRESADTMMTLDDLMVPERVLDLMNACIVMACQQVAEDMSLDLMELIDACGLFKSEAIPQFFSYGNQAWDIELYFYYPGEDAPEPQMEATQWYLTVKGMDEASDVLCSVVFSATLALLKQVDPEMDGEAAVELLMQRKDGSHYHGNGYVLTYLDAVDGRDAQLVVERT